MKCHIEGCKSDDAYLVFINRNGTTKTYRYCLAHAEVYVKLAKTNWNIKVKQISNFNRYIERLARGLRQ